jgi:poly(3-hydroxybutyrate) depolymerase
LKIDFFPKLSKLANTVFFLLTFFVVPSCQSEQVPTETNLESSEIQINPITVNQLIDSKNVSRVTYVRTPKDLDRDASYPFVFFFHGAGGSAQDFLNNNKINELIQSGEFIGVFPNGYSNNGGNGGFWNLGSEPSSADDVEFVNLIMQELSAFRFIDLTRGYALGYSNGSGMVNLLGKTTTHFKAIAPLFSQQTAGIGSLIPDKALSVFQINGEIDGLIPLDGGESPVGVFMSAEDSALNWSRSFDCNTSPVKGEFVWGTTTLQSFSFSNCQDNHEIKYVVALETDHGWRDGSTQQVVIEQIWRFFKQH